MSPPRRRFPGDGAAAQSSPGHAGAGRAPAARGALVPPLSAAFTASAEHGFHGLGQRMVLTVGLSWFAAAAWFLLRSTARKDPSRGRATGKGWTEAEPRAKFTSDREKLRLRRTRNRT